MLGMDEMKIEKAQKNVTAKVKKFGQLYQRWKRMKMLEKIHINLMTRVVC